MSTTTADSDEASKQQQLYTTTDLLLLCHWCTLYSHTSPGSVYKRTVSGIWHNCAHTEFSIWAPTGGLVSSLRPLSR